MVTTVHKPTLLLLIAIICLLTLPPVVSAAPPISAHGACLQLDTVHPHSAACSAEIAANPPPHLVRPVTYDPHRDGVALPHAILIPDMRLPYPIAWQNQAWYFSDAPGAYPENDYTEARRIPGGTVYFVYTSVYANGEVWHLVGPDEWMRDEFVSVLQVPQPPEGVTGRWVALDLHQQTLVAMLNDQPIFATLISSGYYLQTTPGLFHIYARTPAMIMRGPPGVNPPIYVFPTRWVMFFDGHQGLHAMPYHNKFGTRQSHGCVNVPPGDEEWLWDFFDETAADWDPGGITSFFVDYPQRAPWVYVYASPLLPEWDSSSQ
jgi:hypothetical protein